MLTTAIPPKMIEHSEGKITKLGSVFPKPKLLRQVWGWEQVFPPPAGENVGDHTDLPANR